MLLSERTSVMVSKTEKCQGSFSAAPGHSGSGRQVVRFSPLFGTDEIDVPKRRRSLWSRPTDDLQS